MFSNASLTTSGSTEFDVSAEATEELFREIEAAPSFVPHLLSLSITRGGSSLQVGTQWREERIVARRRVAVFKSITNVSTDPFAVSVSIDFVEGNRDKKYAAETFTVVIQPVDDQSCRVIWTMAYVPAGFVGTVGAFFCRRCLIRSVHRELDHEMDCYATEARRREEK